MSVPRHALPQPDAVEATPLAGPRPEATEQVSDAGAALAGGATSLGRRNSSRRARWAGPLALVAGLGMVAGAAAVAPGSASTQMSEVGASDLVRADDQAVTRSQERPALASPHVAKALADVQAGDTAADQARAAAEASAKKAAAKSAAAAKAQQAAAKKAAQQQAAQRSAKAKAAASERAQQAPALGQVVGTRYATTAANIRSLPQPSATRLDTLAEGESVKATSVVRDGWRQVSVQGRAGWVRSAYLTSTKPAAAQASQATSATAAKASASTAATSTRTSAKKTSAAGSSSRSTSASAPGAASGGSCSSYAVESGLVANAIAVHRAVCASFPSITSFGGVRTGDGGNHGSGRALDVMVSGATGQQVANWARANASRLGITEVIYAQHIWTTQRAGEGWRSMSDRGSATANHFDHVHISVR